jgi:hypothetical protein
MSKTNTPRPAEGDAGNTNDPRSRAQEQEGKPGPNLVAAEAEQSGKENSPISTFTLRLPTGRYSILGANVPPRAKYSLCGQALVMPRSLRRTGAVLKQSTKIAVTGCPKAKRAGEQRRQRRTQRSRPIRKRGSNKWAGQRSKDQAGQSAANPRTPLGRHARLEQVRAS